jgi:hypothetical protein
MGSSTERAVQAHKNVRHLRNILRRYMSPMRPVAALGAALSVGIAAWDGGLPPLSAVLDPFLWIVFAFIALGGAFAAVSVLLAWRNIRSSPRWLLGTLVGLLLLSVRLVWPFIQETRQTQRFLAYADSTQGIVGQKYARGGIHLVVDYKVAAKQFRIVKVGENPYVGTPAFSEWERGESIPVYYRPAAPEIALVGHPGPEQRRLFESLAKVWVIWGVLLTAYLPLIALSARRGERFRSHRPGGVVLRPRSAGTLE